MPPETPLDAPMSAHGSAARAAPLEPSPPLAAALAAARRALSLAGADTYEVYLNRSSATRIEAKDAEVETVTRAEDVGLSIRVRRQDRVGFSFTTSLAPDAIERAARSALAVSEVMGVNRETPLGDFDARVRPMGDRYDPRGLQTPAEAKVELALRLERLCREADARVRTVRSASVSESAYETVLASHEAPVLTHRGTLYSASLACKAEADGDAQMGYEYVFSPFFDRLDVDFCARSAAEGATELLGAGKPRSMKCPAVIRNDVVADLIDFLSSSFSGEEIDQGKSLLQGRRGTRVFAPCIDLVDDALLAGGLATRPFDAEGTASRTTALVRSGVFAEMLLDRKYAARFGERSTGNSARGIKSPPAIATTNLVLKPGTRSYAELVRAVGDGIVITNLMGVHTANAVTGNFSLGASGVLIEGGRLTRPVKGFAVAGNILDLFRDVAEVGGDFRFFGSVGAPSLRLPELAVSGE